MYVCAYVGMYVCVYACVRVYIQVSCLYQDIPMTKTNKYTLKRHLLLW